MSYYPILNAPGCRGWVGLSNFPPNNWEIRNLQTQCINVTWPSENTWISKTIGYLESGSCKTITSTDVEDIVPANALPLLSLTLKPLPQKSDTLPLIEHTKTSIPAWRATLGLYTSEAQSSYQGELDPFPPQASLLTFGPFLQFSDQIKNYIILLNIEKNPIKRSTTLEVYDAKRIECKGKFIIKSNSCNPILLDELGFKPFDLPVHLCREMTCIPLYLSITKDGSYLSLEHTHPPASLVVFGKRWEAQRLLKSQWLSRF